MKSSFSQFLPSFWSLLALLLGIAFPVLPAYAFVLNTCWSGFACVTPAILFQRMNDSFFYMAGAFALVIFLAGAFMMTISAGQDTLLQAGKRAMKGSLIGLALVASSYGIYRTVVFLLYP